MLNLNSEITESLKINITDSICPLLILSGQYDFVCPKGLGDDLFKRLSSPDKKIVISPLSGHSIMFQDEVLFCKEVNEFIRLHR
jgi:pimeloyl-ACP methyl ester carboxylesterase